MYEPSADKLSVALRNGDPFIEPSAITGSKSANVAASVDGLPLGRSTSLQKGQTPG